MFKHRSHPLNRSAQRWGWLGMATVPVVGAVVYGRGYQLPWVCPLRHLTGIPCPTCGMTRSFMAIARGDFPQALTDHAFGPVLFAGLLLAIGHLSLELLCGRSIPAHYQQWLGDRRLQVGLLLMFLGYYAVRLYGLILSGALEVAIVRSPLGQMLW